MNREQRVLSAVIHSRQAFNTISSMLDEQDFSELGWCIVQEVRDHYEHDKDSTEVDKDLLVDTIERRYPRLHDKVLAALEELAPVSVPNTLRDYQALKMDTCASLLAEAIMGRHDTEVEKYMEMYQDLRAADTEDEEDSIFISADLDDILQDYSPENLIPVIPTALNDRLDGGVIPGTQICVYAPTEVGKSMFAINMAAGMLNAGRRVLYCGNEDPAKAMLLRFYCRLSEMSKHDIQATPQRAKELAFDNGFGNLIFYSMEPGNVYEVQKQIEKYRPDAVFIDQMANMGTGGASYSKVEKNEYLASKFRSMAKKYGTVNVILHQASDSAYGNLYMNTNDLYYSNVGVQGQMDIMIGIGMDQLFEQQNRRMLCITKNKLSGNHEAFPVTVQPEISKVQG